MVASVTRIQSPHKLLLNQSLTCYYLFQISESYHTFKGSVTYFYVMILPCILVTRQQHILSVLYAYF
jgi:hypothetical protein